MDRLGEVWAAGGAGGWQVNIPGAILHARRVRGKACHRPSPSRPLFSNTL
jgi:hypothetical protein